MSDAASTPAGNTCLRQFFVTCGSTQQNVFDLTRDTPRTPDTRIVGEPAIVALYQAGNVTIDRGVLRYVPEPASPRLHCARMVLKDGAQFVSTLNIETGAIRGGVISASGETLEGIYSGFKVELHTTDDPPSAPTVSLVERQFAALRAAAEPPTELRVNGELWDPLIRLNTLGNAIQFLKARNLWPDEYPHLGMLWSYDYYRFGDLVIGIQTGVPGPQTVDLAILLSDDQAVWVVRDRKCVLPDQPLSEVIDRAKSRVRTFPVLVDNTRAAEAEAERKALETLEAEQIQSITAWLAKGATA